MPTKFRSTHTENHAVNQSGEDMLSPAEAAAILGVSYQVLATWRRDKVNLPFYKIGTGTRSPVRYRRIDVERFLDRISRPVAVVTGDKEGAGHDRS